VLILQYIIRIPYVNHAESVQQSALSTIMNDGQATNATKNTETDTVVISSAGRNAEAKWQETSQKYDVTNISQNEMANMVSDLIENKLISSTDGLHLMAPRSMNLGADVKFDLISTTRKSLDFARENGSSVEEIKNKERAMSILYTLQNLASNT